MDRPSRTAAPLLLLLLVAVDNAFSQHSFVIGSACRTREGEYGVCQPLQRCRQVAWRWPTPCSPLAVCCPYAGRQAVISAADRRQVFSKSQQKCQQWRQTVLPLQEGSAEFAPKCGLFSSIVFGGLPAKPGELPHMAAVGYGPRGRVQYLCGGSLISERWVLTAAHCLEDYTNFGVGPPRWVRLGDVWPEAGGEHPTAQDFRVVRRIAHPEYRYPLKYNDVGLLLLDADAQFNMFVRPACLSTTLEPPNEVAIVSGWGKTENASHSEVLLKAELPLTPQQQCGSIYGRLVQSERRYRRVLPGGIVDSMLCAGDLINPKDSCTGDSGGPLQVLNEQPLCLWTVVGAVSFGKGCGQPGYPGVYSRVASFVPWIESVVWP